MSKVGDSLRYEKGGHEYPSPPNCDPPNIPPDCHCELDMESGSGYCYNDLTGESQWLYPVDSDNNR